MKKIMIKNEILIQSDGKHTFLFWLIMPILLVWLSVSYITGAIGEKPFWFRSAEYVGKSNKVVSYFQEHGSFTEDLNQPFITLWFDDAWASQYLVAYPILKKYDMQGTIAIPISLIETEGYMNWAQVKIMQDNDWQITNHSMDHDCGMNEWNREEIVHEYKNSKFILWKKGFTSDIFVTPCGVDNSIMQEEAKKMFMGYRTVDPGFNDPKNVNFYEMKVRNIDNDDVDLSIMKEWVDHAKATNSWLIILFHKVGAISQVEGDDEFNVTTHDLNEIVKYIKESNIKVVVPDQIFASQESI